MKKHLPFILTLICVICYNHSFSQTFTKITTGPLVTSGGSGFGASWVDYDNDNDQDLFVTNVYSENDFLFRNSGSGSFTKITGENIVTDGAFTEGSTWADYDNDGDLDVFVCVVGSNNFLYQNNGDGTFTKITTGSIVNDGGSSIGCAWGDYDNDGFVDLFVANFYGENNFLYHNNSDGTFDKVTTGSIVNDGGNSVGCTWGDYDNDGDLDLFVANYNSENDFLYKNNGDGTFTKITTGPVVTDADRSVGGSWGDYDNDGDLDLIVTCGGSLINKLNRLYKNNGDGSFTQVTTTPITADLGQNNGSAWGDYDNDGDLDLYISRANNGSGGAANLLFQNNGDATFTKITTGNIVTDVADSRACVWGDYDNDGDLDMYVANEISQNDFLYQNDGNSNKWINIKCVGTVSNRAAIGAKVKVKANNKWQFQEISSSTGYLSQNSINAEFGLGSATVIDSIVVKWPSGIVNYHTNVAINQFLTITETCVNLNDGLVAHYPFNGNADDASGNGNDGTVNGSILTTDRFGNANSAYLFDGVNDYIKITAATALNNNNYTYSWWVKINTLPTNGNAQNMLEIGSGSGYNYGQISSLNNNYYSFVGWRATSANTNGTSDGSGSHSGTLPATNTWYNVVVTRNNSTLKLYVDNQLIYSVPTNGTTAYYSNPLDVYIGSRINLSAAQYFNGTIDDIRMYNRVLSACEINELYNEDCVNLNNGLVAHYPFNGNADDVSGNGYNATVNNGAVLTTNRSGDTNSAYYFDGVNDYLEVADFGNIIPTTEITISMWIKCKTWNSHLQMMLTPDHSSGSRFGVSMNYRHTGPANYSFWDYGWQFGGGNTPGRLYDNTQAYDTLWNHFVLVSSVANSTMKIYKNGTLLVAENDPLTLLNVANRDLKIGSGDNSGYFHGVIDDIRIYNRELSVCEITALYEETSETPFCTVSLGDDQTVCSGESVTLTATSSSTISSYLWSNGEETSSITVNPIISTSYYLTVTTSDKCTATDTITVSVDSDNLSNGLVAYYPFNGNANDESENLNNGAVTGAVLTTDRFGNANSAYSFNGSSDYINIADDVSLRPANISISCWVKTSLNTTQQVIYKGGFADAVGEQYSINLTQGSGSQYPLFGIKRNSSCTPGVGWEVISNTSSTLQISQWNHIVTTYDGSYLKLYKNNVLISSAAQIGDIDDCSGSDLLLGRSWTGHPIYFNGSIDDIRIYNRALSDCEITTLYEETSGASGNPICSVDMGPDREICLGENLVLSATGDSISTYLWSTGETTSSVTVSPGTNTYYAVQTVHENGCQDIDTLFVTVKSCTSATITPICIVGVDSASGKNMITWNKPSASDIDSFIVYKETNQSAVYEKIGSRAYKAFSTFVDSSSNPQQQAYLYKLGTKYNSGELSELSMYHKTIHLSISEGVGNTWNLNWNHYEGFAYSTYNIYRSHASNGMLFLTSISSSLDSYTDLDPPTGNVYYQIEVVNSNGCTPGKKESYSSSRSNIVTNAVSSVNNHLMEASLLIYPNPNTGSFVIEVGKGNEKELNASLFNSLGQQVYETRLIGSKTNLTLGNIPKGIYLLRVSSDKESVVRRIVVE